ncbi:MarR family transcriptional regulator [Nonomuraea glycinis]|uniref:MarR family transcriptional regulator n=1 Tax=Nonomuraea glycinis TaxID=2047744 RepID=UPI002E1603D9|nr:MarR family transcriptional regulator [Nonomuraea glycinis]
MPPLDTLLAGLARERSTGALRVGRAGTVFLDEGRVTYMDCAQTPGVERLLAARGRVSEAALRRLQADGGCERLLEQGPVTLGELQYCVLGAVLDAAFFLLPTTGTRPKFRPGERHWLGGRWYFDVPGLVRECARRRARLAQIWPAADVDTAPVRPTSRLAGRAVALSDVQWEVVVRADGEATSPELAKRLGRSSYSVMLAVRRLAAAGLLVTGEQASALPKRDRRPEARQQAIGPRPAGPLGPQVNADPTDIELLLRLKKALEELS